MKEIEKNKENSKNKNKDTETKTKTKTKTEGMEINLSFLNNDILGLSSSFPSSASLSGDSIFDSTLVEAAAELNALASNLREKEEKETEEEKEEETEEIENKTEPLPKHNTYTHGKIIKVGLDGVALTEKGEKTLTAFFQDLDINRDDYSDVMLSEEEARSLAQTMRHLSTGANAAIPLRCAPNCPFLLDCWYAKNGKQPVGRRCLVEKDLIVYHTKRFIEEFQIQPESHSELMLVQELSELIVMETRLNNVLSLPGNAQLMQLNLTIAKTGEEIETEAEHWAVGAKEKIKNRRMKIMESFLATREGKWKVEKENRKEREKDKEETVSSYSEMVAKHKKLIEELREINEQLPKEAKYEVV